MKMTGGDMGRLRLLMLLVALPVGAIWGIIAIAGASPNPPEWTRYAPYCVGGLSALLFAGIFTWFHFRPGTGMNNRESEQDRPSGREQIYERIVTLCSEGRVEEAKSLAKNELTTPAEFKKAWQLVQENQKK